MPYTNVDDRQYTIITRETLHTNSAEIPRREEEKRRISILLVDDHALMREGLRQLFGLEEDLEVVGEAADGLDALQKVRQLRPQIVLMDVHLPVIDGLTLTRQITHEFPATSVIILTFYQKDQQMVQAMKNGARGYLFKNSSVREVVEAIRRVHQGDVYIKPEMTKAIVHEFQRLSDSQCTQLLSEKEIEIIRYLATGMSNREIAERLAYSEKTVKNYLSTIFQKLHLRDRTQLAIFALRQGLLPEEEI
ncbi:response regulator transcription factor [Ktedonosporobacter rubrisoli]|nr:response regulator transcription factor [Ktedonosporobacter rubrisoli]